MKNRATEAQRHREQRKSTNSVCMVQILAIPLPLGFLQAISPTGGGPWAELG